MLLYIGNYESAYQYHKFLFLFGVLYIYAEIDFGVHMICNFFSIDDDCVDGSKE